MKVINEVTDPETAKLAEICLRSTFFSFQGEFYEQVSGVAMGSPLSPIVANLFMESFEKNVVASFPLSLAWWKIFVDDTNIKWSHVREKLDKLFNHLNSISSKLILP